MTDNGCMNLWRIAHAVASTLVLCAAVCGQSSRAHPEPLEHISGRVFDPRGTPVPAADVWITSFHRTEQVRQIDLTLAR